MTPLGKTPDATTGDGVAVPIPRQVVFGEPRCVSPALSPCGRLVAWLADEGGATNLIVGSADGKAAPRQVTGEARTSISPVLVWARTGRHVVVFRDRGGDENYRAFSVDVESGAEVALTPAAGTRCLYRADSPTFPGELLFSINRRDASCFDLVRIDVVTGRSTPLFENPGFSRLHVDHAFAVRVAERVRPDGSVTVSTREPDGKWKPLLSIPPEDALVTRIDRLSADGRSLFVLDTRGRDKAALIELDIATRRSRLLVEDADADIVDVVYHPRTTRPLAAAALALRRRWHLVDARWRACLERLLETAGEAELGIVDVDAEGRRALVRLDRSDASEEYRVHDLGTAATTLSLKTRPALERYALRPMTPFTLPARDGLPLTGYLTEPANAGGPVPLVMLVHGGPFERDRLGYSSTHQWLASRGYAVLGVNFRGSSGFGKAFVNAADREWGGKMQDDLIDGVRWAVARGVADPNAVALSGASYGGYAALMAACRSSDVFACFVDVCGPSSLSTFMRSIPPYWGTWFDILKRRLADPDTEAGERWLAMRSPVNLAADIERPLLVAHGDNDVRVRREESERIVAAVAARGVPVVFVTFPDEGHFIHKPANRRALAAVTEHFLAIHLGGAHEPLDGAIRASSLCVEFGWEHLSQTGGRAS